MSADPNDHLIVGPIVAIVDDDPDVRGSLDSLMRSAGIASRCFCCAEDLLADARVGDLGCIVTDLHMPGLTGLELQAELAHRGSRQPVIIMTAYPTTDARAQAMRAGAIAFLTKPIDPDGFLDAIAGAMRDGRTRP